MNNENRLRTKITKLQKYFKEYCSSTSIHGFRYFGEDRSTCEKTWWVTIFLLCLSACSFMIYKIYEKYETTPVIVTFATKETPIRNIPFPAVTICPEIKTDRNKFNLTEIYFKKSKNLNLTKTQEKNFHYLASVCNNPFLYSVIANNTEDFTEDFLYSLSRLKPNFNDIFLNCRYMNQDKDCHTLFTPVITDDGVCYSFNLLDRTHIYNDFVQHFEDFHKNPKDLRSWNMEDGYLNQSDKSAYPLRALYSGATNGLKISLKTKNDDIDYLCQPEVGFKVVLHSPVRIPRLKQEYFRVSLNQAVIAAVQPVMITTSQAVKQFDVKKRDCYFPTERKLKYFRTYSQQNCLLECLTNVTIDLCDCVQTFMPRNNLTSFCGINKQECIETVEEVLHLKEFYNEFHNNKNFENFDCDCLPLCSDLSYSVDVTQSEWHWKKSLKILPEYKDIDENSLHLSSLTIYFRFNHFITSERQELYGPTDFVANFGGLLGLFTGFSILSLMEIIYFLTVRICCNLRMYGRWSGNE